MLKINVTQTGQLDLVRVVRDGWDQHVGHDALAYGSWQN